MLHPRVLTLDLSTGRGDSGGERDEWRAAEEDGWEDVPNAVAIHRVEDGDPVGTPLTEGTLHSFSHLHVTQSFR